MRVIAIGSVGLAMACTLSVLAAQPGGPTPKAPAAKTAAPIVADKTRIDPVKVDPKTEQTETVDRLPGLSPADELKTIVVQKGFELSLAAQEPNVADPVDVAFDEAGAMYIAEFKSYPYSEEIRIPQQPTPIGKHNACLVRKLVDKDGDGVYETSTVFADSLSWVMSVACYDGGLFVLAPPYLYYIKDTNGDGIADERRVVLSGFSRYNVQAAANNLRWGLDNHLYIAAGSNGGDLEWNGIPVGSLRGQDFSFDPRAILGQPSEDARKATKEKPYQPEWLVRYGGGIQFGNTFDDWGHRFVCSNSDHIRQDVFPLTAANRTAGFTPAASIRSIASDGPAAPVFRTSPPEPWRVIRTKRRISDPATLARLSESERSIHGGFFTSATGVTIYRGDAYPDEYRGNAFIGDVGGNLIHRKVLVPNGAAYIAHRADEKVEFVTSTDTWFRPVNFMNGPDGCLYVLDMYRETIEHPYSIPEDIKAHLDLESGSEIGRIWRLQPPGYKQPKVPNLGELTSAQLVPLLAHKNVWHRETASRLLFERQDKSVVPAIRSLLNETPSELGRVHALYALSALESLTAEDVAVALKKGIADNQPNLTAIACKIDGVVGAHPELADALLPALAEPSRLATYGSARFELSLAIADWPTDKFLKAFLLLADLTDGKRELTDALMSSVKDRAGVTAAAVLKAQSSGEKPGPASGLATLSSQLISLSATRGEDDLAQLLNSLIENGLPKERVSAAIRASGPGLRQRGSSLVRIMDRKDLSDAARQAISSELTAASATAVDTNLRPNVRLAAFQLLSLGPATELLAAADEVFTPQAPQSTLIAIARAVADNTDPASSAWLVDHWSNALPAVRIELVEGLMRNSSRTKVLLDAVEAGNIRPVELPADRREQLRAYPVAEIRDRAVKLFEAASADRNKVVAEYEPAIPSGSVERGLTVFKKACSQCHKVGAEGFNVGPQLASVKNKSERDLLLSILDPNREALPQYMSYTVATDDGRVFSGILASETDSSVTLRRAEGKEDVIPREQIEVLKSSGQSLMPVGIEKDLTPQDVADVIAWIKQISE